MIPRIGEPVVPGRRYKRRPGIYAVLLRDGAVLLTHQSGVNPEYQLPGGGIDRGESPIQALHREVFEETGWRIQRPRRLGAFRRFAYMPEYELWAEKICHIYMARPVMRMGPPLDPEHTAAWMSLPEAVNCLGNEGDALFLERCGSSS